MIFLKNFVQSESSKISTNKLGRGGFIFLITEILFKIFNWKDDTPLIIIGGSTLLVTVPLLFTEIFLKPISNNIQL